MLIMLHYSIAWVISLCGTVLTAVPMFTLQEDPWVERAREASKLTQQ